MKFDPSFIPASKDGLPPALADMMDRAFYKRRAAGLNVQFIREDGLRDEFSFADPARRDGFTAALQRQGKAFAVSGV